MENDEIKYKKDIPIEWLKMPSSAKEAEKLNIKKYFIGDKRFMRELEDRDEYNAA
ncbi:hypothetical [Prochlorococcus marinus subsp. pastoris str. CCMP1986]|uniref:Uncharacterized protein n=1 Tax=Prochlorococcus marinus subsp. pastoris (strain CCMP1986 / NIES-2087 / MED4) TaxID=59919 RepID=Q7V2T3_PROMP|nr:hypothetical protein [Prochlorococcus marinus]KGF86279.1 hypothetical protein PROCH_1785 [Prochlorococcus marinus str. EQPAC1]CAE18840.1 hypothetical [Prochlorococcus marinus subsp. pastoris str. CCMP1986]